MLTTLSTSAIVGQQVYGPYGNTRYQVGSLGTTKGYTGQFHDAVSGLDYYHARYYDPVVGQFLSVDEKQGNAQGADPYSYVAGNPETATDPTGLSGVCAWCAETGIAGGSAAASGTYPTFPQCQRGYIQTGTSCSPVGVRGTPPKKTTQPSSPPTGGNASGSSTVTPFSDVIPPSDSTTASDKNTADDSAKIACDTSCANRDRNLILSHHAAEANLTNDISLLVLDLGALLGDWLLSNVEGMILDGVSVIVRIITVVGDIIGLNGNVPVWLSLAIHLGQYIIGTINMVKGAFILFGGLNALLDSFSFAKGAFTLAKDKLAGYLASGLGSLIPGWVDFSNGVAGSRDDVNLNTMSPQEIQRQCLQEQLNGC